MLKRIFIVALIILMSLSFYCVVFADSNIENDEPSTLTAQDDNQETTQESTGESRELTTSRRYSLQIGIALLIIIGAYKIYKYIKCKKRS